MMSQYEYQEIMQAEREVLYGLLLQSDEVIAFLGDALKPEYFYYRKHKLIYEAIMSLYADGEQITILTVCERLRKTNRMEEAGGRAEIIDITLNTLPTCSFTPNVRIMRDFYTKQRIKEVCSEVLDFDAKNLRATSEEIFGKLDAGITPLRTSSDLALDSPVIVETAFVDFYTYLEDKAQGKAELQAAPTGFYDLDIVLGGGLENGDLVVVAGRPAMGKSAWALQAAYDFAKNKKKAALYFSAEMSTRQLMTRLVSQICRIETSYLNAARISDRQWGDMLLAQKELTDVPLYIANKFSQGWEGVIGEIRRQHALTGLGLVVIDYLQLLTQGDNLVHEIGKATRSLKLLALELEIPIVILSQLSRALESRQDKRPHLSDLRDSGTIEQDADKVFALYREEYYAPDTPDRGIAELIILKNRSGPCGTVKLLFDAQFTQFKNLARGYAQL